MLFSVLSLQKMICHSKCQEKINYLLWSFVVSKLVLTDPPTMTPGIKKVSIGSSLDSHVKCVEDPGNVHCDHTAKQLGRTGHLSDYFEIILATVGFDNSNTTELLSMN